MFCEGKYEGVLGEGDEKYWMRLHKYEQGLKGAGGKIYEALMGECLLGNGIEGGK